MKCDSVSKAMIFMSLKNYEAVSMNVHKYLNVDIWKLESEYDKEYSD